MARYQQQKKMMQIIWNIIENDAYENFHSISYTIWHQNVRIASFTNEIFQITFNPACLRAPLFC